MKTKGFIQVLLAFLMTLVFALPVQAAKPVADFTADVTTVFEGGSVTFTDLSTSNPRSWRWSSDGSTPSPSTEQHPTLTFNTAGTYRVTLSVRNSSGSDRETKRGYITVIEGASPPTAEFSASETTIDKGDSISFTDLSSGNPDSWRWILDGGDPSTSRDQNPDVIYNTAGSYRVVLKTYNDYGDDVELKAGYITVIGDIPPVDPPIAEFSASPTTVVEGNRVVFTDLSTGNPTSWDWSFTGGKPSSSAAQNPEVVYNTPGDYAVTLTATNAAGDGVETKTDYITVIPYAPPADPPVAEFTVSTNPVHEGSTVTFTDLSTGNPTSWNWSFTGGSPTSSTAQHPEVLYKTAGKHTVTLKATNAAGDGVETKTDYITVLAGPPPGDEWKIIVMNDITFGLSDSAYEGPLQRIASDYSDFEFILFPGDLTAQPSSASSWETYYDEMTRILGPGIVDTAGQSQVPPKFVLVPGNHDVDGGAEQIYWDQYLGQVTQFGNNGKYGYFDYKNARFIIIDANDDFSTGSAQDIYIRNALETNDKEWLIASFHQPLINNANRESVLGKLLYDYGCDIIFSGHEHVYVRTKKLAIDSDTGSIPEIDTANGVTVVTNNTAGQAPRDLDNVMNQDWMDNLVESSYDGGYSFTSLTFDGSSLNYKHISETGTILDEVNLTPNTKPGGTPGDKADMILRNGNILTVDADFSTAQAIAIKGECIMAVGTNAEIDALADASTEIRELNGKTVIPGLIDNHAHYLRSSPYWRWEAHLDCVRTKAEAEQIILDKVTASAPGDWILTVGGWKPDQFSDDPTDFSKTDLDALSPNNPVFLMHDFNGGQGNTLAVNEIGCNVEGVNCTTGEIVPYASQGKYPGMPDSVRETLPTYNAASWKADYLAPMNLDYNRGGITAVHSFGAIHFDNTFDQWSEEYVDENGEWSNMRIFQHIISDVGDPAGAAVRIDEIMNWGPLEYGDYYRVTHFGEIPYMPTYDTPSTNWNEVTQDDIDVYQSMLEVCALVGWPLAEHMILEEKIDMALDVREDLDAIYDINPLRWANHHTYEMTDAQMDRSAALGQFLAMQNSPAMKGGAMDRYKNSPRFRSAQDSGIMWGLGTDSKIVSPWPAFFTLYFAVTGKNTAGETVLTNQTVTREQALIAHTRSNAWELFMEDELGSIEVGKYADIVVLDRDYMTCPEDEIRDIESVLTIVGGRVGYEAAP